MRHAALLVLTLAAAGCATMANDQREKIAVRSEPAGAVVSVECGATPVYGGVTPAVIIVDRAADPCALTVAKEGYEAQHVELTRTTSRATMGNKVPGVMVGTLFGLVAWFSGDDNFVDDAFGLGAKLGEAPGDAIDRKTGAAYKHVPGAVFVKLDPAP
jgi:hypothetical protein